MAASVARRTQELRDAEEILERSVDGEEISPDEEGFLSWLWAAEFDRAAQLSRVRRRLALQTQAASGADRAAAKACAEETATALATEGERLRQLIAESQARLSALEREAESARAVVERHAAAVEKLHDPQLLNDADRTQYERRRVHWEKDVGRQARTLRGQAAAFRERAGWHPDADREKIAQYVQAARGLKDIIDVQIVGGSQPGFIVSRGGQREAIRDERRFTLNATAWQAHAAELRAKADEAEAEATRLEEAGAAAHAAFERMLDALVPE